jgi:hypothetical protein
MMLLSKGEKKRAHFQSVVFGLFKKLVRRTILADLERVLCDPFLLLNLTVGVVLNLLTTSFPFGPVGDKVRRVSVHPRDWYWEFG